MYILFDIGGTHFRCYIIKRNLDIVYKHIVKRSSNVLNQLSDYLGYLFDLIEKTEDLNILDVNDIRVSIAGIVDNYKIYGCKNAGLEDGTQLIKYYKLIKYNKTFDIIYINDADAYILGEIQQNDIIVKDNNILGIIFGTGVGCGLIINGSLITNCEIHKYLEPYMKENYLGFNNIIKVSKFLANEFSKFIELLNLDYLIVNGYINNFSLCKYLILKYLSHNKYYKTKIIFSDSYLPIVNGLITL